MFFVLCDKNLRYQQNLLGRRIAIIELPTNRWPALQKIGPKIKKANLEAEAGSYQAIPGER